MVLGVLALVMGIMLPTVRSARASARSASCMANLRQSFIACAAFAADNDGVGPAIGQPYGAWPNWALVVQKTSGMQGDAPGELYSEDSVLVCDAAAAHYAREMVRTFAMNATGHAGDAMGDSTDYDAPNMARPAAIRFDAVREPSSFVLLVDSAVTTVISGAPPPNRCASVIDFRQPAHVEHRLGWWHASGGERSFNAASFDGAVRAMTEVSERWSEPLP